MAPSCRQAGIAGLRVIPFKNIFDNPPHPKLLILNFKFTTPPSPLSPPAKGGERLLLTV
jgi:hypothetical protein